MRRVDAHCHFWSLERGDYDWLSTDNAELRPIARDFSPEDIAPLLSTANVHSVVLVQAAATEAETDFLLSLADQHSAIAGVVGWVDLSDDNAASTLERWSAHAKFKGIRPMLQDIDNTDWLMQVPLEKHWSVIAEKHLCFDALVQPRHLPMLATFCEKHPAIAVVIDHAAKPKAALAGNLPDFEKWQRDITLLAKQPQVYCKLSGLLTEVTPALLPDAKSLLQPYVDTLLNLFGSERLMWGSDWPVLTLASSYSAWNTLTLELLHGLNNTELANVLGGTADKFYSLRERS